MNYSASDPLAVGQCRIVVVSKLSTIARAIGHDSVVLQCQKQPAYVVIEDRDKRLVWDMDGANVPFTQVNDLCPMLDEMLEQLS